MPVSELRVILRSDETLTPALSDTAISRYGNTFPPNKGEQTARGSKHLNKLLDSSQSPSAMMLTVGITKTGLVPNIRVLIAELYQNSEIGALRN